MTIAPIVAAGGSVDLIVGMLLGACIGLLVGPALRSWLSYREWAEASREARLADQLLTRLEIDADLDGSPEPTETHEHLESQASWRTSP